MRTIEKVARALFEEFAGLRIGCCGKPVFENCHECRADAYAQATVALEAAGLSEAIWEDCAEHEWVPSYREGFEACLHCGDERLASVNPAFNKAL